MLTEQTVSQAQHLSSAVMYHGNIALATLEGTPLNKLVKTLVSFNETGTEGDLISQSNNQGSIIGSHSEIEEYTAQQIAKVMGNIIDTAKNVVNPHCRAILEGITARRNDSALSQAGLLGTIKQIDLPEILLDEMFMELIAPYQDAPAAIINNTFPLFNRISTDFTAEELILLIKTGSPLLDARIDAILGTAAGYLGIEGYSQVNVANLDLIECVTYFLLLTGIQNEKLDKASAIMADPATKLIVATLRAAIAGKIFRETEMFDFAITNGEIIARDNFSTECNNESCLTVYGVNYRQWIQSQGGSPEAALGYLAERGNRFNVSDDTSLRTNAPYYYTVYTDRIAHAKSKSILTDILIVRSFTGDYLADVISKMTDVDRPALQLKLKEALAHEYHGAVTVNNYVIKVVSRSLTEGSDVKDILLEVDSVLAESAEPNMAYAVYIASIRLIARWIKSQISIETPIM